MTGATKMLALLAKYEFVCGDRHSEISRARFGIKQLIGAAELVAYAYMDSAGDHINGFQVDESDILALRSALIFCDVEAQP